MSYHNPNMPAIEPATRPIAVTHQVTDGFLEDVMCTAVESGYSCVYYWIREMLHVERRDDLTVLRFKFRIESDDFTDVPTPEGSEEKGVWVIDHDAIALGIKRILSGEVKVGDYIVSMIARAVADNDADIDSDGADCIVQAAVFNSLVYG